MNMESGEVGEFSLIQDASGDLLLSLVSFLNARDGSRLARTCRRAYYWIHQYRKLRGPEFVAAAACSNQGTRKGSAAQPLSNKDVVCEALDGIQAPPNLCLAFHTNRNPSFPTTLLPELPPSTLVLGVRSTSIQSVIGAPECDSPASLFLGTIPQATSHAKAFSFALPRGEEDPGCEAWSREIFLPSLPPSRDPEYWKVMMVYCTHTASSEVETFLKVVQGCFPKLQIVGGICAAGFVSQPHASDTNFSEWTSHELVEYLKCMGLPAPPATTHVVLVEQVQNEVLKRPYYLRFITDNEAGFFGVLLGGDVPVETAVSRGVKSTLTDGPPTTSSNYVIHEADYHEPTDEAYMFTGQAVETLPAYHMIRSVRNVCTSETTPVPTWLRNMGAYGFDFVGMRQPEQDGFCLHQPHPLSRNVGGLLFFQDATLPTTSTLNYEIDLFSLDGEACRRDVQTTLQALQQEVSGKRLLGGCMFSCAARGPSAGMLGVRMADAAAWYDHFPKVPLLGWYAGGEIGSIAMAGRKHALRGHDTSQRATLQGFTAVFALWIVPVVDWDNIHLDDATETVEAFCRASLLQRS